MIGFLFNLLLLGAAISLAAIGAILLLALGVVVLFRLMGDFVEWLVDLF